MTTYRLFPSTQGPSTPTTYSGNFLAGVAFEVTAFGSWFEGFWWWVPTSGDTGAQQFVLWELVTTAAGVQVPGGSVTSGQLVAGQWNYVPLPAPVALTATVPYVAVTGWHASAGFSETNSQFGAGEPYAAGITSGPLTAYSDNGGGNPPPNHWYNQGAFTVATADPTSMVPNEGSDVSSNFWMDVQVSDTAPTGSSCRLWPGMPVPLYTIEDTAANFTLATEFTLSQPCTLDNIWFYSPPGTSQLPTECGIWQVASQTLVPGTDNPAPAWSGAAASGWVSCGYTGLALPPGDYKVAVFNGAATPDMWNLATINYWSDGPGGNGITVGPLSAPDLAAATSPGQGSYDAGQVFRWPGTYAANSAPCYWVDVEVTAATAPPPPPPKSGLVTFFP
ncbi:MAG TPA: hypothetical protein VGM53_20230 [Streptosporangiaceae bacterium]|jgi:hypothetical protein